MSMKKIPIYFITLILIISFLLLPFSWFFATNFNTSNQLEKWINTSGLYQSVVTSLSDQVDSSAQFNSLPDKNLVKNYLNQAINKSLPKTYFDHQVNKIVGGYFNWLDGRTTKPNFQIDLRQLRLTFVSNLNYESAQFINECVNLVGSGQCSGLSSSIGNFSPAQFNQVGDFKFNSITSQNFNQFITVLFKQKNNSQPIRYSQLSYMPRYYRDLLNLRIFLIVIIFLMLLIGFILLGLRLKFLKVIFKVIVISDLLLAVSLLLNNLIEKNILTNKLFGQKGYGASLSNVLKHIFKNLNKTDYTFIIAYLILGVVLILILLILKIIKRKHNKSNHNELKIGSNNQTSESSRAINF